MAEVPSGTSFQQLAPTNGVGAVIFDRSDLLMNMQNRTLDDIARQDAQLQQRRAAEAERTKDLTADLDAPKGFAPEHVQPINDSYNQAVNAMAEYTRMSPSDPRRAEARRKLEMQKGDFGLLAQASKGYFDNVKEMNNLDPTKFDTEKINEDLAALRSTPIKLPDGRINPDWVKRTAELKAPPMIKSFREQVQDITKAFSKPKTVGAPTVKYIGGQPYVVETTETILPEDAKQLAFRAMEDSRFALKAKEGFKYMATDPNEYKQFLDEAKKDNIDINDTDALVRKYAANQILLDNKLKQNYEALKESAQTKQNAILSRQRARDADEAAPSLGFLKTLASVRNGVKGELEPFNFTDPLTGETKVRIGKEFYGTPVKIGKTQRPQTIEEYASTLKTQADRDAWNELPDNEKLAQYNASKKAIEVPNNLNSISLLPNGNFAAETTQSVQDYKNKKTDTPFRIYSPIQLAKAFDLANNTNAQGQNALGKLDKALNALNLFDKNMSVDYDKIIPLTEENKRRRADLLSGKSVAKAIDMIPAGQTIPDGTRPTAAQTAKPAQQQTNRTIVKKGYNAKTNQTQLIYSDGTKEIVNGRQ